MKGIAHENHLDVVLDAQPAQHFDIVAPALALQRFETLRGDSQFVAEGQPDPLPSEIERQDSPQCCHDSIVFGRPSLVVLGS